MKTARAMLSFAMLLCAGFLVQSVFAAPPPPGGYPPGATLDPECIPHDPDYDCFVRPLIAQDKGVDLGNVLVLNFIGDGVTTTMVGNVATVTVPLDSPLSRNSALSIYSLGLGTGQGNTTVGADTGRNIILGYLAADKTTYANRAVFLGNYAGGLPGSVSGFTLDDSNFIGNAAGYGSVGASDSNAIGGSAGSYIYYAQYVNSIGLEAGLRATNSPNANFIGYRAGSATISDPTEAGYSNFIGYGAGYRARYASYSNFIGRTTGQQAINAANSIFIGTNAGVSDTVNNRSSGTSILIGNNTGTGGFKNSIALGAQAKNTALNQLVLGANSGTGFVSIETTEIIGSSSTCTITTGTNIACSSDERLKDNVVDLDNTTLDKLLTIRPVSYNWKNESTQEQIGFLAQDLESQFPQLVTTDSQNYKSVFYSQITPVLTKSIQELHQMFADIFEFFDGDRIRANDIDTKLTNASKLCVGKVCITEAEFLRIVENSRKNNMNY